MNEWINECMDSNIGRTDHSDFISSYFTLLNYQTNQVPHKKELKIRVLHSAIWWDMSTLSLSFTSLLALFFSKWCLGRVKWPLHCMWGCLPPPSTASSAVLCSFAYAEHILYSTTELLCRMQPTKAAQCPVSLFSPLLNVPVLLAFAETCTLLTDSWTTAYTQSSVSGK